MSKSKSGMGIRVGFFALLAAVAYWLFSTFGGKPEEARDMFDPANQMECQVPDEIIPADSRGEIEKKTWFALSYVEKHEQAEWVAYELTGDRLRMPWHDRPDVYLVDYDIRTGSADTRDYSHSGYSRGHLCAAADMAFSEKAILETFYMSNMSPQLAKFNGGIWQKLERKVRRWAKKKGTIYVITGPVFSQSPTQKIGRSGVTVPSAFYKVLYDPNQEVGIGFVLPHQAAPEGTHFMDYACSIDEVEAQTGLDFFPVLLDNSDGRMTEAAVDRSFWK